MASNNLRSMTKDQLLRLIGQMQDELAAARTERSDSASTRYQEIFQASLDATIVEDDDGRIREANPAACELFGYKHDDWPRIRVEQLVHPASMGEVDRVRKSKPSQSHLRLKLLRRDQSVFEAEVMALRTTISGRKSIVVIVHDMSRLLDAQQLLETSEKTLNEAQELAGLGSYVWDLRDDSLTWSRNMYAIAGLNIYNFAGNLSQTIMDIIHPEDRDRIQREVAEMVERKETRAMEFRIVRPDGRLRHLRSGSRFVFDETGRPIKCVGVHYDITDHKETAWALAHSKANFETLVENLADAVFAHDLDGNLMMVNKLACESTGYTREELLGMSVADIDSDSVSRDDQKRFWLSLQPGESVTIEAVHCRKDGSTYPAEIKINRIDIDGHPAMVGLARDITRRKQATEALRESEEKHRALYENAPLAYQSLDEQGGIIDVNPAWLKALGYRRQEVIGSDFAEFLHPDSKTDFEARFSVFKSRGHVHDVHFRMKHRDGTYRDVSFEGCIGYEPDGRFRQTYCVFQDITDRIRAEKDLQSNRSCLRTLIDASPDSMLLIDPDGMMIECNQVVERVFGRSREELVGSNAYDIIGPEVARLRRAKVSEVVDTGRTVRFIDERFGRTIVNTVSPIFDEDGKVTRIAICGSDTTDQRQLSEEREAMLHLLQLGSTSSSLHELIKSAVEFLSRRFDFEAVGIRLQSEDDFPYFETRGFAEEFVQAENSLCVRDPDGQVRRDRLGNPLLECMCGNIIRGRFNPDLPFFTEHGSFWSNSTTELLGSTSEEDRQARTRNRCNGEGYESVGLFPLRSGGETYGLLQMNDHRRERFTPELVDLFERLAGSLAAAVGHFMLIEQLQQSEADKSLILDSTWEMFAHLDWDLTILWGNKASGESVGLPREEIIGRHCYDLWHNRSEPCENCPVLKARDTGEARESEIQTPDGRWFHLRGYPLLGADGKVESLIEYGRDITEEKRAEQALRESEEKWRSYVENAPYGVFVADEEGRYIDTNPAAIRITGHSREELLRMRIGEMLAPAAREDGLRHFRRVVEEGSATGEYAFIRRDGERRYWSVSAVAIAPDRFLAFVEDVSDRKKDEQALRESEEKFRGLTENVVDWIWQVDMSGAYTYVSPQVETIMGYEPSEIIGKTPFDFMSGEEASRIATIFSEAVAGKKRIYGLEDTMQARDGRPVIFETNATPLLDANGELTGYMGTCRDITDRKKAELALRESEAQLAESNQLLAGVLEHTHMMSVLLDTQFNFVWVNRAYADNCGYEPSFFPGKNHFDLYPNEENRAIFRRVVDTGEPVFVDAKPFEFPDQPERGVTYWDWSLIRVKNDEGNATRLVLTLAEVTERIRAEDALQASERFANAIADTTPSFIYVYDVKEDRNVWANRTLRDFFPGRRNGDGQPEAESCDNVSDFIHPDDFPAIVERLRLFKESSDDRWRETEYRFKDAEREWIWLLDRACVFERDDESRPTKIIGAAVDVTHRKRAEQALRESEDRYRSLVENMQVGVALIDKDMRMVSVNRQFREWFPDREPEGHEKCFELLCTPAKDGACPGCCVEQTLREGTVQERIVTIKTARGTREIREVASPISSGGDKPVAATLILEDITDRLSMEKELAKAEKLESIGVLAGGIAHDFNNILVAILGNISLARMELPEDSEISSMLSDAEHASERARDLTQQLLTFAKGGSPVTKSTDIKDLISESAAFTLRGSNSRCEFDFADDLWQAQVDPGQFSQVIGNLVINAAQAMPQGGVVTIRGTNLPVVAPSVLPLRSGNYVLITVSDTGVGIQEEVLARIFDPFFTTKDMGNGLGLTSCYSIVKRHGGHVNVSSQPDQGATFSVYIPASAAGVESDRQSKAELVRGSGRVLVVDDESSVLDLAAHLLTRLGYEPATAANGSDAIRLAWEAYSGGEPFAAAIIDLTIPGGMGGVEILRQLKRIDPGIRAIVSSGYYNDPIMSRFDEHGFVGRIAKPYRAEEFSRTLAEVLLAC